MSYAKPDTAQARGREWDKEVARRIGGRAHPGSGNRITQLDAGNGLILVEGKHTDAESMRLTPGMIDQALSAVLGPEAMSGGYDSFLAIHFGLDMRSPALAVVDLDLLVSWLKAPPEMIAPTSTESRRATARTPRHMRD